MESRQQHRVANPLARELGDGGNAEDTNLDRLRGTERLLAAADAAIARALSSDSERFLRAARQTGGQ